MLVFPLGEERFVVEGSDGRRLLFDNGKMQEDGPMPPLPYIKAQSILFIEDMAQKATEAMWGEWMEEKKVFRALFNLYLSAKKKESLPELEKLNLERRLTIQRSIFGNFNHNKEPAPYVGIPIDAIRDELVREYLQEHFQSRDVREGLPAVCIKAEDGDITMAPVEDYDDAFIRKTEAKEVIEAYLLYEDWTKKSSPIYATKTRWTKGSFLGYLKDEEIREEGIQDGTALFNYTLSTREFIQSLLHVLNATYLAFYFIQGKAWEEDAVNILVEGVLSSMTRRKNSPYKEDASSLRELLLILYEQHGHLEDFQKYLLMKTKEALASGQIYLKKKDGIEEIFRAFVKEAWEERIEEIDRLLRKLKDNKEKFEAMNPTDETSKARIQSIKENLEKELKMRER